MIAVSFLLFDMVGTITCLMIYIYINMADKRGQNLVKRLSYNELKDKITNE